MSQVKVFQLEDERGPVKMYDAKNTDATLTLWLALKEMEIQGRSARVKPYILVESDFADEVRVGEVICAPTKFEEGKLYATRSGRRARIYATDGIGKFCLHGAIEISAAMGWEPATWTSDGKYCHEGPSTSSDLVSEWKE